MRIEKAPKVWGVHLALNPANEENIIEVFRNDPSLIRSAYPELGASGWINGFLTELYCETEIISLPEIPPPQFSGSDNNTQTTLKAADAEWKVPRAHLCLWVSNQVVSGNPVWVYKGKISLLKVYGYPSRRYRLHDYFTDNLARELGENSRIGVSFQWVDRIDYYLLSAVEYFADPNGVLNLSRFTLDVIAANIKILGWRTLDGSALPIEPTYTVSAHPTDTAQRRIVVSFTHENRVNPNTVQALIEQAGEKLKLTSFDKVTIDGSWRQEVFTFQPDYVPTPIVAQSVTQVTRQTLQTIYTATTARQVVLSDRPSRTGARILNRGATNAVFYKLGSDVTTSPLIPAGQTGTTGGYHGSVAPNGSADLPAGYTGTVSIITSAGQTQALIEETFLVSGA